MILFSSENKLYNYVIHHFMEVEGFSSENRVKSFLKKYVNPRLVREQSDKCVRIINELFNWTSDRTLHEMSAFHEVILYDFLEYIVGLQDELDDFYDIYFDKTGLDMITVFAKRDKKELPDMSLNSLKKYYLDVENYVDAIFSDTDFLNIEMFCNDHILGDESLINYLGIDMDYYFEILPKDIRDKYKTGHCTLRGEICALIEFLKEEIEYRDLYKLFWNKKIPVELSKVKIILNNIILFYFRNQEIDIVWDILETKDSLKLIFNKKGYKETQVMIEIIDVNKRQLKKEIIDDMFKESFKFDTAFFIFLVSCDIEKRNILDFISSYIYTDYMELYLNVDIFDYRKRDGVSKKK